MRAKVKENDYFRGYYTDNQLRSAGLNVAYYEVIGTGRHIAVHNANNNSVDRIFEICIDTYQNEPIYKQCMQLQLGRNPQTKRLIHKVMQVKPVNEEYINKYKYRVYTVVNMY